MRRSGWQVRSLIMGSLLLPAACVWAQEGGIPSISLKVGSAAKAGDISSSLQIIFLLTILSLAPSIVMLLTSFSRIVIVLGFTRSAMGTQQIPPNSILIGLALFLTVFTMQPTFNKINTTALQPYLAHKVDFQTAQQRAMLPVRDFMFRQTREADLQLFVDMGRVKRPRFLSDVPTYVLVPAFIISELKTAFTMGFLIYIPFVIIDLVVATVLMSLGMMMMPPVMISLPCKLLLFTLIDGWSQIAHSLVASFH